MPMSTPLLAMRNIDKRFMGAHALAAAALEVEPAEVMGLVGQNGAGKSTLIKVLTGAHRKDAGEIVFGGETVEFASPLAAQHGGISTIYQEINLIPLPLGRREYFPRPRISPLRTARLAAHEPRRRANCCAASPSRSTCAAR